MARTVLPVQQISRDGLDVAFVRPDNVNGHSFDNDGHNNFIMVRNNYGDVSSNITVITPASPDGLGITDRVFSVPGGVASALADDGGTFTDETTEANEATVDDMTLLPATPAVGDAYYFGSDIIFQQLAFDISTAGAGSWTIVWEYWDGSGWVALDGIDDGTTGFTTGGNVVVSWEIAVAMTPTTVNGIGPYWWVRARVSVYTSITTQPLGQQVFGPRVALIGPFPAAVYDTIDTDPDPDIDPAVFVDVSSPSGLEIAIIKLPGASY